MLEEADVDSRNERGMSQQQDANVIDAQTEHGDLWRMTHDRMICSRESKGDGRRKDIMEQYEVVRARCMWIIGVQLFYEIRW